MQNLIVTTVFKETACLGALCYCCLPRGYGKPPPPEMPKPPLALPNEKAIIFAYFLFYH